MTFIFLGDDRDNGGDARTVAWISSTADLDPSSSVPLTLTSSPAPDADLVLTLQASLPVGATLSSQTITIPAGATEGSVTLLGSATLEAGSGSVVVLPQAGVEVGDPSAITVTTSGVAPGGGSGDQLVGSAWIGGVGAGRQLQWPTFEPTGGQIGAHYSAGGERAQIDTVMDWGDRKLCAVGCFGPSDTMIQQDAEPMPLPAENGVYPIDPWAGVTLSLEGLPSSVGAAGDRAVATLANPLMERKILGAGAATHEGADLWRLAGREVEFLTDLAAPLRSPAEALVFATTRVDKPIVLYEITLTNSGISSNRSALVQEDEDTGTVYFDALKLNLPSGLAFVMQDTYAGAGGPDPSTGHLVAPFGGSDSHGVKPSTNFSWIVAVYEEASVTAQEARSALEGASTGLVLDGPQRAKRIGALGHRVMDWTRSVPARSRAEIGAQAQIYVDNLSAEFLTSNERVGMHSVSGPRRNGGAGGNYIHFMNTWMNACPEEIKGLRILTESFTRRVSNANHVRGEFRPRFQDSEVITREDPWFGGSKEWTVSPLPNRHQGGLQAVPVHIDPFFASSEQESAMPTRDWADSAGRTFPTAASGHQECLRLDGASFDDQSHNWSNATSHSIRDMHVRDSWIISKSGLAWWRLMSVAAFAEGSLGAREGTYESQGVPGARFIFQRTVGSINSARYVAGINPVDSSKALTRKPGFCVAFGRHFNGLQGPAIDEQREHLGRFYGGGVFNVLEGIACSPMAPDIRASMLQDVEGPRPEEDYDFPRAVARTLGWTATEFGACCSNRGNSDPSDPFDELVSNRGPNGENPGFTRRRDQAGRKGPLPGGRVTGDGTAQGISDGVSRVNYAINEGPDDEIFTHSWNNWQHAYHAQVAGALIEHFRAQGLDDSHPLIAGIMPVARAMYYAFKAQESHPAATADYAPQARYQPCTIESTEAGARAMTLQEQQSAFGSWNYSNGGGVRHYFLAALGSAEVIFDDEITEESMLASIQKGWLRNDGADPATPGQTFGTADAATFYAALAAAMWENSSLTFAQFARNECQVLARLTDALPV